MNRRRYEAWVAFIERRHRAILLVSLVLMLLSILSLTRLRLDIDVLNMLPAGEPAFDNFKRFIAEFGELDELVILLQSDDASGLEAFAGAFVERLRGIDSVVSVRGRIDTAAVESGILGTYLFNYAPESFYDRLAARLTPPAIDEQVKGLRTALQAPLDLRTAHWVRRDPFGLSRAVGQQLTAAFRGREASASGYIGSADGKAMLLMVRPKQNAFDHAFTTRFMRQVRDAERSTRDAGGDPIQVGYTGSYVFALEDAGTIQADVTRYTVLALIGVLAVFYAGYRNLRIVPFVTYPLLLSTGLSFVASLVFYSQLNAVSLAFAAILYGLSIDSAVHYYTRLLQEMRGNDLRGGITRTLSELGAANIVASATTAAALFVIGFSKLAGISQLGTLSAVGMLINIVQFFVLYPAMSFWMAPRSLVALPLETPRLGQLAAASARHARVIGIAAAVVTLGLLVMARDVPFDADLTHLRPGATAAAAVQDEIAARFGADTSSGALLVRRPTLEEALQVSEQLEARLAAYKADGSVHEIHAVDALLPSEKVQRARLARLTALPRAESAGHLRTALVRYGFRAEAFEEFLQRWVDPPAALVRWGDPVLEPFTPLIARFVRPHGGMYTVAIYVEPGAGHDLGRIAERLQRDLPDAAFVAAGRGLMQAELGHLLRRELVGFCIAAFVLNLILVLWNFPHLGLATAILLPELLVILIFLGLVRVWGDGIDPVNLIVVPLILGIGVDNCVYVAERYQRGEAIGDALRNGGRALSIAALTTMAGFGFVGLSKYPALAGMGGLAAICLFLCLVASITLLPALFEILAPRPKAPDSPRP